MPTPRLAPLRRMSTTHATYLADTAADDTTPAPKELPWGRCHVDDMREMGIDAEAARKAWRSSEYAAGHAHGYVDGTQDALDSEPDRSLTLAVIAVAAAIAGFFVGVAL